MKFSDVKETTNSAIRSLTWPFDKELLLIAGVAIMTVAVIGLLAAFFISTPQALVYAAAEYMVPVAIGAVAYGVYEGAKKIAGWFKKPADESQPALSAAKENDPGKPVLQKSLKKEFSHGENPETTCDRRTAIAPVSTGKLNRFGK